MIIKAASVLTVRGPETVDVRIGGGVVEEIGPRLTGGEVIDAAGSWLGPGFVDLHAHLREPGEEWKEDIESGSAAAAAGGYTAIMAMPNTDPPTDTGHLARYIADRGRSAGLVDVVPVGAITMGRSGERLSHLDELWSAGVRMFSDDGSCVADAGVLRYAMEYLGERGGVVAQHAEDHGLSRGGHMHEGAVSSLLGMRGLPAAAEEVVVARDLALVRLTGCRYHAQHVSTTGTIALIRMAKKEGLPVTAEVTPHHLSFTDADVAGMSPDFKMYPPLRTGADRDALRVALADGTIDAVATDHAPHAVAECEVPFEEAPRGVIGVETAAAAVNMACGLGEAAFFERMSVKPAAIGGLSDHGRLIEVGSNANLTVFHPRASWQATSFRSKSSNSPWRGMTMVGKVVLTILNGVVTYRAVS